MTIAVIGSTTGSGNGTSGTLTFPTINPSNYVEFLCAWINASSPVITPPAGFTAITGSETGTPLNNSFTSVWRGWAIGSVAGLTVDFSVTTRFAWVCFSASGAHPILQPDDANFMVGQGPITTTTVTTATVTPTVPNDAITAAISARVQSNGGTGTFSTPAGTTLIGQACSSAGAVQNAALGVFTETQAAAGASTARNSTFTTSPAATSYTWRPATVAERAATLLTRQIIRRQAAMTRASVI